MSMLGRSCRIRRAIPKYFGVTEAGIRFNLPKRVFRRDEVVRLRDEEGLSWRAIGKKLGIPAMTALDSYRQSACTETVVPEAPVSSGKRKRKTVAA